MKITVEGPFPAIVTEIPNNTLDPRDFSKLEQAIGAAVLGAIDYRGGNGNYDAGARSVKVTIDSVRSEYHFEYERFDVPGYTVIVEHPPFYNTPIGQKVGP